jgi:hypothetical protein
MAETVAIEGLDQLVRTMRKAGRDLSDLKAASQKAAQTVAQWGAVTAPRRTGTLGASVRGRGVANKAYIAAGGAAVPYAGVIHWGWPGHHIAAQPWLSQAAQDTEPAWSADYERDVQAALDKVTGA